MNLARFLVLALVLALAGCSCDPGSGAGFDADQIRPDAAASGADAEPAPDAEATAVDAGSEVADASAAPVDASQPPASDAEVVAIDAGTARDASAPEPPDAAAPGLDAAAPAGPDASPSPVPGLYDVTGSEATYGAYRGQVELRPAAAGGYTVHHVQTWDTARFEGEQVALAWEGTATDTLEVTVTLDRVGFVRSYQGLTRDGVDPAPVAFTASFARTAWNQLSGTFAPQSAGAAPSFQETWTWSAANGADPLWHNQRVELASHDPIPAGTKATLFTTYAQYHTLPEMAPYVGRADFQEAMHYFVRDYTDLDFYRAHPDTLRVIQRLVDPIALVEARLRNRALRQTLAEKAAVLDAEMPARFLNSAGMLVANDLTAVPAQEIPSGDSMLWTGVYAASQAMRYEATKDPAALQNLLTALRGQFMCFDIVGTGGDFARTIRVHVPGNTDPSWVQGTGTYAGYDWQRGANNDMLKGYWVSFPWAHLVLSKLSGYTAEQQKMVSIIEDLVANFAVAKDGGGNELIANGLLYWMTGSYSRLLQFEQLFAKERGWIVDQGNGAMWEYGTSDWSGNHLIVQSLLTLYLLCDETNNHTSDLRRANRIALENLRDTRLGLYQLITATVGDFGGVVQPELEEALLVMQEIAAPKVFEDVDWRVNPSYSMSPFPSLPWKNDWMDGGRLQSLRAYPIYEAPRDVFAWKDGPFRFRSGLYPPSPGADYLFAYWFARKFGVVDPAR
ncbi:MAG TPA: hypothetical protein VGK67_20270 [Myxococcales bacterium]|jgi:hypothetical protein